MENDKTVASSYSEIVTQTENSRGAEVSQSEVDRFRGHMLEAHQCLRMGAKRRAQGSVDDSIALVKETHHLVERANGVLRRNGLPTANFDPVFKRILIDLNKEKA